MVKRIKQIFSLWREHVDVRIKWGITLSLLAIIYIVQNNVIKDIYLKGVFHRLYYLPIFMGSLLGGLKGGLICAVLANILYLPSILPLKSDTLYELTLFYFFGLLTGFLVDKEKAERERLRQAEHLALIGQAAAAIAHELKTPLVVIGGFARVIQKKLSHDDPNREKLEIIIKETNWLEEMIHGMLNLAKPLELNPRPEEIKSLVKRVVNLVNIAENAQIKINFLSDIPCVKIDAHRFNEVLMNLLTNAVHAAPNQLATMNVYRSGSNLIMEVIDKGPGIPKKYKNKIFQPFFSTKNRSTGLGLATVKKIVDAHGGKINFHSEEGKGTTFVISLPLDTC